VAVADQGKHGISWTDVTWNPIRGCRRVNADCVNCYAEQIAARFSGEGMPYHGIAESTPAGARWTGKIVLLDDKYAGDPLTKPLHWKRPRMVFVNSMSDLFYEGLAFDQIDRIVSVMALAKRHTFQVLTKRPERMLEYFEQLPMDTVYPDWRVIGTETGEGFYRFPWPIQNVWWGASMGHRDVVDEFMPHLERARQHAAVLWGSFEPLTEELTNLDWHLQGWLIDPSKGRPPLLDWAVGGGESTKDARPCPLAAARGLRDVCNYWRIPFHWKQWGEWLPYGQVTAQGHRYQIGLKDYNLADPSANPEAGRIGKHLAGRLLDGVLHDAYPRARSRAA
jgi:protein gp37